VSSLPACSLASLEAGEPLLGTAADSVDRWILLEVSDPWAPEALETEALSAPVRSRLEQWLQAPRSRLQLVRRPGRAGKRRKLMVVSSQVDRYETATLELERYEDLLDVDPAALDAQAAQPLWLVCVHGRRDRCCASHGGAVFRAMQACGAEVWQTSHLGGHRFAACVLSLPEGFMYGRVRPEHAPGFMEAYGARELGELSLLRGRCAFDKPTQAAEVILRKRLHLVSLAGVDWLGTSPAGEATWEIRFRVHGAEQSVQVRREQTDVMRPASCGAEPEPVTQFLEA
jgi:hypothetical protein